MYRRNARKVDADTALATTSAAAQAVDMMRDLMAEYRVEIDSVRKQAEAARLEAAEAKMFTQACEARERGLRVDMAAMRTRISALERANDNDA
jgi:predicted ATP-grasp superfamily ATP-dependent carboligase